MTRETGKKVEFAGRGNSVIVTDLDAATEAEDVAAQIGQALGSLSTTKIGMKNMRPERNGNKSAEVSLPGPWADRVLRLGKITIGWVMCRVREKVGLTRCYRCLETVHLRANCKGQDLSRACLRCGQEGHLVKECPKDAFCMTCKVGVTGLDILRVHKSKKKVERPRTGGEKSDRRG